VLGSLGVLHQYTGLLGALGLAAAAALMSDHFRRPVGADGTAPTVPDAARGAGPVTARLVHGIEALGAVSLSADMGQSLV
ncbi:MAG: hypothetical protein ACTH6N_15240, partial [Brachybacterium tyrofermentans]